MTHYAGDFFLDQTSRIGQGTWKIDYSDHRTVTEVLAQGIDLGLTHIDTAEMYDDAELVVGNAIKGKRDKVFLVSKVLPSNASRFGTVAACERSLERLKTDVLDCYLLHWRGAIPLQETVEAMERLISAGKIRSWGVSNFDEDDLAEITEIAGEGRIACNQVLYHLRERAIEHAVVPWCEKHRVAVVAYSPFGHNDFPEPASRAGRLLHSISDQRGASPRQVALAFLTCNAQLRAIPKASTLQHVSDNAAAAAIELSDAEYAALDAAFPRGRKPAGLPML